MQQRRVKEIGQLFRKRRAVANDNGEQKMKRLSKMIQNKTAQQRRSPKSALLLLLFLLRQQRNRLVLFRLQDVNRCPRNRRCVRTRQEHQGQEEEG